MEEKYVREVLQLIELRAKLGSNALRSCWDRVASGQAVCHSNLDPEMEGTYTVPSTSLDQDIQHGVDRAPVKSGQED